jgi:hypothetical protein
MWNVVVDDPGQDHPHRLVLDAADNVYVCVITNGFQDPGVRLIKLAP